MTVLDQPLQLDQLDDELRPSCEHCDRQAALIVTMKCGCVWLECEPCFADAVRRHALTPTGTVKMTCWKCSHVGHYRYASELLRDVQPI